MRELSEATLDAIEAALAASAGMVANHNTDRALEILTALAEFREWRAGRAKATEPGECEACKGSGLSGVVLDCYPPRHMPCPDCNGTGKRKGGEHG